MRTFLTVAARKRARVEAMRRSLAVLCDRLRDYAREKDGRFVLFGSAARGELRFDSDVDILVDFAEENRAAAWRFAEDECWRLGLTPDVRPLADCRPAFVSRVTKDGLVIT